jgi:hypothetical protein
LEIAPHFAPPESEPRGKEIREIKEITFDPFYGSTVRVPHGPEKDRRVKSPFRGRSRDSLSQRLIRLR